MAVITNVISGIVGIIAGLGNLFVVVALLAIAFIYSLIGSIIGIIVATIGSIIGMFSKTKDDSDTGKKSEDGVWSW